MKKDRNCGMGMPIYPGYMPNMMPGVPSMGYPMNMSDMSYYNNSFSGSNGSIEQQLSNLNTKVSSLERRVSNLENLIGNNTTTYNTNNYQML